MKTSLIAKVAHVRRASSCMCAVALFAVTLQASAADVTSQPTQALVIEGGAQDRVVLQGLGWVSTGETNATATHQYAVFTNGAASVLVEQHMATSMGVL
jgi:hypothetical protein